MKLTPGWQFGALLGAEAVAAAGVLSYVNTKTANSDRGTYALGANKITGQGGVDVDVLLGSGLVVLGAVLLSSKYAKFAPHAVALGAGALSTFASRTGSTWERKKLVQAAPPPPPSLPAPQPQPATAVPNSDLAWGPMSADSGASAVPFQVSIK